MTSGSNNRKNSSRKGYDTDESTPLVMNVSYRVVDKEDPDEVSELPEPTLWASRLALFLARCIPGHGSDASLRRAWSFFEYMILPRRVATTGDGKTRYVRAAPGRHVETSTLYPAWTTPVRQLRDFGTGVAVYFEMLLTLFVVCFVAGLLYLPSMHHYANDGYKSQHVNTALGPMGGSLICPDPVWVPCLDCRVEQWKQSPGRYGINIDGTLVFALKNTCAPLRWQEGVNHLLVMIFLAIAMYA